ncbi:MAG: M48 family metalloprotease [Geminicoccaceae bacterium]|nr:M48 family metalloprotease [Geminicoccaceae bacterium]MCB9942181.1 M48 family metalloprotease [Geminicoccaceae bacterium]
MDIAMGTSGPRARSRSFRARLVLALLALMLAVQSAVAQQLIRDEEIERILAGVADPLFSAAGLDPDSVKIYMIADPRLNAFVAGGQNLFINTGLLMRSESLDQVAGVIAHETGHIAGGHLSRIGKESQNAAAEALIGALLGAAAAVAGAPQLGTAIVAGGATVAQRNLLAFSRAQEQSADQAAIGYLEQAGRSPEGLLQFFQILENQNLRINVDGSEFLRTHPLTRNRIAFLVNQVDQSPLKGEHESRLDDIEHARMVAKLDGFLDNRNQVFRKWQGDTIPDIYARAIAYYRSSDIPQSLELIDQLLAREPDDPWFNELKGQILFETGDVAAAVAPYRKANREVGDSALLKVGLARALMESGGDPGQAIDLLREASVIEPQNPSVWRFLGLAYGRDGHDGEAALALAEHAMLLRNRDDAQLYLAQAKKRISQGDPGWVHLLDLERAVSDMEAG